MDKLSVALIGVGAMGKKYAEMISGGQVKNMELAAVVCRSREAKEWAGTLKGSPHIYGSSEELFANPEGYEGVLIATPHRTHPSLTIKALSLGKAVMCDKPAGVTAGDAEEMAKAAEKAGRSYGLMFHQRLYPKYIKLKELIDSGDLGSLRRILLVNTRYFRTEHYHKSSPWRSSWRGEGGGALINQGQHILDIWQWLFGMPQSLYADVRFGKYNSFRVDDEAAIYMSYPDNLTAAFILTTGEAVREERLEVIGTRGRALLNGDTLRIWRYGDIGEYAKTANVNSTEKLEITEEAMEFEKSEEPYVQMLENFALSCLKGEPLAAEGKSGINALALTNAAYYSAWTGERVCLPLDNDKYAELLEKHCNEE